MSLAYRVNDYITLKLDNGKTKIFFNEEEFVICRVIPLNIPKDEIQDLKTMDEIIEKSKLLKDEEIEKKGIDPETEFWVHCSNLKAWAENKYNTDLIDTRIAFPLLKRLVEVGDKDAKKIFKEDIVRRYGYGSFNNQQFLTDEGYLKYLSLEEIINGALEPQESNLLCRIINFMNESVGITYDLALTLDEDRVRHRVDPYERYFSILKGHVYEFEFDLFPKSFELFHNLSIFKGLEWFELSVVENAAPDFSGTMFESIRVLKIFIHFPVEIPDTFDAFPNLRLLEIFNNSSKKNILKGLQSLTSLSKFNQLNVYNCIYNDYLSNELSLLKENGLKIIIKNGISRDY